MSIDSKNSQFEALVNEPDDPDCKPKMKWRIRHLHDEMTQDSIIEIRFRTRAGTRDILRVASADRVEFLKIYRALMSKNARIPFNKTAAIAFVELMMRAVPREPIYAASSPGFRDQGRGFIMPGLRLGTARHRYIWNEERQDLVSTGTLKAYRDRVLVPAAASPFLCCGVLIPMASALWSWFDQRSGKQLVSEGAIFHFASESSAGKTTVGRVARSVTGDVGALLDYEGSPRAVVEEAYRRNSLVLVIDDTEAAGLGDFDLLTKMRQLAHRIPSGVSKAITSRGAGKVYPALAWTLFAISTGPETIAQVAQRVSSKRHGDRVRFFDIEIPDVDSGGIFAKDLPALPGSREGSQSDMEFLSAIEAALSENAGVLIRAWVKHLLSREDVEQAERLVAEFCDLVFAFENALEARFARKLGVLYAAGIMAVDAGLLPWPKQWVLEVVRFIYDNSRRARDPHSGDVVGALKDLAAATADPRSFVRWKAGEAESVTKRMIGLRRKRDGKTEWLICPKWLSRLVPDEAICSQVNLRLRKQAIVNVSGNVTPSEQVLLNSPNGKRKHRFWKLDRKRLFECAGLPLPPPQKTQ